MGIGYDPPTWLDTVVGKLGSVESNFCTQRGRGATPCHFGDYS